VIRVAVNPTGVARPRGGWRALARLTPFRHRAPPVEALSRLGVKGRAAALFSYAVATGANVGEWWGEPWGEL
jgi:hypothetical protein